MEPVCIETQPIIRPLAPGLQEIAIKELNENPQRLEADVLALRKWISKQQHLRARLDDQLLVSFLRGSKFSLEKAKQKIDRYYTLKSTIPEVFNERRQVDDPLVMDIVRAGIILQIPLGSEDTGPCITIIRAGSYDTNKFKFADVIRVGSMFGDIMMLENDNASVKGYMEIMDMSGIGGSHFFQLHPDLLRRFSTFAEEAMPTRQRGTHFINVPAAFEKGFNTLKSIFPVKMTNKVSVSSSPEAIYSFVSRDFLPAEYGGTKGTIQDIVEAMEAKILRHRQYFADELQYGVDEKLRDCAAIEQGNDFGIEGSFRKLDID